MAIPMLKIRRPTGRLIFNMGIPIPGKTVFYIETGPWWWAAMGENAQEIQEEVAMPCVCEEVIMYSMVAWLPVAPFTNMV